MAVIRINKTADYTVMSNAHFKEKTMSLKAKGLLSLMLSLPDGWDYSIAGLVTLSKDGKDSVMSALDELEKFKYLVRTRITKPNGQFDGYDYDIFEKPFVIEGLDDGRRNSPKTEKPKEEKPYAENPNTGNPQQLNTNQSIPNQSIPKQSNTQIYKDIVEYLNEKAKTSFRPSSKTTQEHIHARIAEGFTLEDFKIVIDKKCAEWMNTEWQQYLRPATLFGTKFEGYLNAPLRTAKEEKQKQNNNNGNIFLDIAKEEGIFQ